MAAPPDLPEMRKRDRGWGGQPRRGSRSQIDSRHAIAMSHIGNARVTSGGKTRRLDAINLHDVFHSRPAGTERQQLRAGGVEDEHRARRSHGKIDERDWFETGTNGE